MSDAMVDRPPEATTLYAWIVRLRREVALLSDRAREARREAEEVQREHREVRQRTAEVLGLDSCPDPGAGFTPSL